jgi:hypothetical protein
MNKKQKEELKVKVGRFNASNNDNLTVDYIVDEMRDYVKASNENRLFCSIKSVSRSGMSRTVVFYEMKREKNKSRYYIRPFYTLFLFLGYKLTKNDSFKITGCGANMIFVTHNSVIMQIENFGIIGKAKADILSQRTPTAV